MTGNPGIIYDLGANNGDDIPYYLKKAQQVVAVEANPLLCQQIRSRFAQEIAQGRLHVENVVLVEAGDDGEVPFHLSRHHHVLGQFPRPPDDVIHMYDQVLLPSRDVMSIIRQYGPAYYIKIDLEKYDEVILRTLFLNGVRPPFISAESHHIAVFALLVALGGYRDFKLVDGKSVCEKYRDHPIAVAGGVERYSFPHHSAGPFGDDIGGAWLDADALFRELARVGLGWKDIHARRDPGAG